MDMVCLLAKSAQDQKYIFFIVDYATLYPKVVPLLMNTSKNIVRELMTLFSHVGLPNEL